MNNLDSLWNDVLEEIKSRIAKPSFETWLKQTELIVFDEETAVIEVPSTFVQEWLEKNYIH